jgi:hypothetical protein
MTDKKAEIPFSQNAVELYGNKELYGAYRKSITGKHHLKNKTAMVQRRVFRSI